MAELEPTEWESEVDKASCLIDSQPFFFPFSSLLFLPFSSPFLLFSPHGVTARHHPPLAFHARHARQSGYVRTTRVIGRAARPLPMAFPAGCKKNLGVTTKLSLIRSSETLQFPYPKKPLVRTTGRIRTALPSEGLIIQGVAPGGGHFLVQKRPGGP